MIRYGGSFVIALLTFIVMCAPSATAIVEGSITLDHVEGNVDSTNLGTGFVTFNFRVTVYPSSERLAGLTNGLKIYSPDGATWSNLVGDTVNGFADPYELFFYILYFSADGMNADTVGFAGSKLFDTGHPAGYDTIAFTISLETQVDDDGKTLCIDSSFFPQTGRWLWANPAGQTNPPDWGGPYCFTLDYCLSDTLDSDNDGITDICDACPYDPDNDSDSDGICGDVDNCPANYNPDQHDYDGDSYGDACDPCPLDAENDADGDGVCEKYDNCDLTYNPLQEDSDGDKKGDSCDVGQVLFTSDVRCGAVPLEVTFSDLSIPIKGITDWYWDFGDGVQSYDQNPTHEYSSVDAFDVTLIVGDGSIEDTLTVADYITTQSELVADFQATPVRGRAPLTVVFSPVLQGAATGFHWDFGDGNESTIANPIHVYESPGVYDVEFIAVLEANGCDQADTVTWYGLITVSELHAAFGATPVAGEAPLQVQFTDLSSGTPSGWNWIFSDGGSSPDQNPLYTFTDPGIYDVSLRVTDALGQDSTIKRTYIKVDPTGYVGIEAEVFGTNEFGQLHPRPGFNFTYSCSYTNIGSEDAPLCTLNVLLPEAVKLESVTPVFVNSGTYGGYTFVEDTLKIGLSTVGPSPRYGGQIDITVNVPGSMQEDDSLYCYVWFTYDGPGRETIVGDYTQVLSTVTTVDVRNDMGASPLGEGALYGIEPGTRMTLSLNFINLTKASDTIQYVRILDTLDTDLDWSTVTLERMSHPDACQFVYSPYSGEVSVVCDDIDLPPDNELHEGVGFVVYSVSPKKDLPGGTQITSSALVRFDFGQWMEIPPEGEILRTILAQFVCGDANGDEKIDISDLVFLADFMFGPGPEPVIIEAVDVDSSGELNIGDLVYLVDYMFNSGPEPNCG